MDVRTLTLGVLTHGAMTGYEIKKCLEGTFRHFVSAGYGSIYPALAELAQQGLVTVESVEQEKRPDKKIYALTEAGRQRLVADLVGTEARHRVRSEFLTILYFAHLLPPAKVAASLDTMRRFWTRWLVDEIEPLEREQRGPGGELLPPGMRFVLGYGRAVVSAALGHMEREGPKLLAELEAAKAGRVAQAAE